MYDQPGSKCHKVLEKHKKLKKIKQPWLPKYQTIAEYVFSRKANFTRTPSPGEFLNDKVLDSTAASANHLMASTLIGALYPSGSKTFQIVRPSRIRKERKEVKEFFERITKTMVEAIDHPRAGFLTALEEYMLDQGSFGISGIYVEETGDPEMPVRFTAVDAKKICVDEGADGFIDTVYIEREYTIRQLDQMFGFDQLSEATMKAYLKGETENKIKILHAVEPRASRNLNGFGNGDFPIASIWIEVENNHIIKESGFHEMPIFITRFWKAMDEVYGRSPAMEGIGDILEINALREASIIATEKLLDPPLLVKHDGSLGSGTIDTSAGAITVQYISGRIGDAGNVVEPLVTVGELNSTFKRIEELREIIFNTFFIDRLLDLNNETRMTYGEAQIRNELRGQSLGTIYARQIAELFTRVIERVFNILLGMGLLGVPEESQEYYDAMLEGAEVEIIPNEIVQLMQEGKDAYKVVFISPAARIMRAEELAGILRTVEFATQTAGLGVPQILDNFNWDTIARRVADLSGAASDIMLSEEEVEEIRAARQEQQMAMAQLEAQALGAKAAKDGALAMQAAAKSQSQGMAMAA